MKKWNVLLKDKSKAFLRAHREGLPLILAELLEARGIENTEELFGENCNLSDPMLMVDMDKAVKRIWSAIESFEKIAVYGDYDVDGITATAMVYEYLESCGANVMFYIPDREGEGYGLNCEALQLLHEQEVTLIVTVDNGISCMNEVEYATTLGMDIVITDHHQPMKILPKAAAIVNPHRSDCQSPYKHFSGVGVAFKLIMALEGPDSDEQALLDNYADFVALGTIGDVVPLTGENRYLVKTGLELLNRTDHPGLRALIQYSGLGDKEITAENVAFILIPKINATGRMSNSSCAVHLLIAEDEMQVEELAEKICAENESRKETEALITETAIRQLREHPERLYDRVLVVDGEGWHPGVIGIVSAKLSDRFGKPAIVISRSDNEARGSGRSVGDFSLFEAVCSCEDLLIKFGGHPMAAGMTMPCENIEIFRRRINEFAAKQKTPKPEITVDCILELSELSVEIPEILSDMEPFGAENPSPVFGIFGVVLEQITPISYGKHLRLTVSQNGIRTQCMMFCTTQERFGYHVGEVVDLVVTLSNRFYQGNTIVSVCIKEIRPAGMDTGNLLSHISLYEKARRGDRLSVSQHGLIYPARDDFALLYRYIRNENGFVGPLEVLASRLPEIPLSRMMICLDVLEEHRLIQKMGRNVLTVSLQPAKEKVDLFDSEILHNLDAQKIT